MQSAEVRKRKGSIEEVVGSHSAQRVDDEQMLETIDESVFGALIDKYRQFLSSRATLSFDSVEFVHCPSHIDEALTPRQVNMFLRATLEQEENENYAENTGLFMTRLVQNSYNAGYNGFKLCVDDLPKMKFLLNHSMGTDNRLLTAELWGDVGHYCLANARNVNATVYGDARIDFGSHCRKCELKITGDTRQDAGKAAQDSTIIIEGTALWWPGEDAMDSTFYISAITHPEVMLQALRCTFKTADREMLKAFIDDVNEIGAGGEYSCNRIVFVHEDGREELVEYYDGQHNESRK
jgi:hypothetical protein